MSKCLRHKTILKTVYSKSAFTQYISSFAVVACSNLQWSIFCRSFRFLSLTMQTQECFKDSGGISKPNHLFNSLFLQQPRLTYIRSVQYEGHIPCGIYVCDRLPISCMTTKDSRHRLVHCQWTLPLHFVVVSTVCDMFGVVTPRALHLENTVDFAFCDMFSCENLQHKQLILCSILSCVPCM